MSSNKKRIPGLYHIVNTQKHPGMVVAEIGCFEGETTLEYIDIVREMKGHVYVLDWMCGSETGTFNPKEKNHGFKSKQKDRDGQRQRLEKNLKEYIDIGMVTILDGPSGDLINLIPNRSLDVCFIDADHRYHSVYRDIDLCIHKVKFGGILCGHDCELFLPIEFLGPKIHPGVIRAVWDQFDREVAIINPKIDPSGVWYIEINHQTIEKWINQKSVVEN